MADLNVIWEDNALKLLETRDRYTRNAIREEFRRDPEKGMITIDPSEETKTPTFLTPVWNNRFSVIWRRDGLHAVVRAVVPLTNLEQLKTLGDLNKKAYVSKVVDTESKGEIKL